MALVLKGPPEGRYVQYYKNVAMDIVNKKLNELTSEEADILKVEYHNFTYSLFLTIDNEYNSNTKEILIKTIMYKFDLDILNKINEINNFIEDKDYKNDEKLEKYAIPDNSSRWLLQIYMRSHKEKSPTNFYNFLSKRFISFDDFINLVEEEVPIDEKSKKRLKEIALAIQAVRSTYEDEFKQYLGIASPESPLDEFLPLSDDLELNIDQ